MSGTLHTRRYRKFCQRLIGARQQAGLTQVRLAEMLKKPQSYVAKCEGAQRRLDVIEFLEWAKCLGLDVSEFLAGLE